MSGATDPYAVLGVTRDVSDDELRRVYRELVKRHHPDHNGGSPQSALRFEQIQTAYAAIAQLRRGGPDGPPSQATADGDIEDRIARLEREMAAKRAAERLHAESRAPEPAHRPTPEELGQYTTDDSFAKIIDDAADQVGERLRASDAGRQFARRLSDLFGRDDEPRGGR